MELIDGKKLSAEVKEEVRQRVDSLCAPSPPTLALVQVGEDPASGVYVRSKIRSCGECGIESNYVHLPRDATREQLLELLGGFNADLKTNGILLQLPLPSHLDEDEAISSIDPIKDVDGFHPENLGLLASGSPRFVSCTPAGIMEMLLRSRIDPAGKSAVVIGRSVIVGKPMAMLLSAKRAGGNATVTVCHSRTPNISEFSRKADIIIAALGKPMFVTADMVKQGAVVIDVGINRIEDKTSKKGYRLAGDVDFKRVSEKTSFITPVPGGVGPMTVAMLMVNTLKAFELQADAKNVAC